MRHSFQVFFALQTGRAMTYPLAALASDRSGVFTRVASLLLVGAMSAVAQDQPVRIKIINAKTNHPVTDEKLNVSLRVDQIGAVAMGTDSKGIINVDTGRATTIRILSNMYADCRPRGELYTDYPLATIRKTGITTGSLCGGTPVTAKPGELILFEIPKAYVPTYPNPPVTTMPHSDERPDPQ
jgi:hypothetical protein